MQIFFRDPIQYSQFGIFFGLLILYIFNLKNMHYDINLPFWKNLITFLNLASVCLTLSTLSTRFFFPQISLEGKSFWILGMSPLSKSQILFSKFSYSCVLSLLITVTLTLSSNHSLGITGPIHWITLGIALMAGITLPALSVGIGALFPNFNASGAAEIVSGFGGTLTLIVSMIYITLLTSVPAILGHLESSHIMNSKTALTLQTGAFCLNFLMSCLLSIYVLRKGIKNLEAMEF